MPRKGLDILQQKSWHVLRRHNIERVRKDQREEGERIAKEKVREERALFQSQIESLRKKNNSEKDELPKESINLFKIDDLKELKNIDKEKEDLAESDKQARKDGFLNYVGETVLQDGTPWYAKVRNNINTMEDEENSKEVLRKLDHDPFQSQFKAKMAWSKKPNDGTQSIESESIEYDVKKKKKKEKKKEKKRKKSKRRDDSPELCTKKHKVMASPSAPCLDELRRRKEKREEKERTKEQELMDKVNGIVRKSETVEEEQDERKRTYNNSFNPGLNRYNQRDRHKNR